MEAGEKQGLEDEMARREEGSAQVARGKKCWLELEGAENPRRAASSGVAGITAVDGWRRGIRFVHPVSLITLYSINQKQTNLS
jgi:hypothetical protein